MNLEITKFVTWTFWLEVGGFYSVMAKDSGLLGCYTMSAGKQLQMFQWYKGTFTSVSMDCLTVKMEALQYFRNVGNYLTVDMACCSTTLSSSDVLTSFFCHQHTSQLLIILYLPECKTNLRQPSKNTCMPWENIFIQI